MKSAIIVGTGIQGVAIAHGLYRLGYKVSAVELSSDTLSKARIMLDKLNTPVEFHQGTGSQVLKKMLESGHSTDVVVSAVPFHLNFELAQICVSHDTRYCDLGGNNDVAAAIKKFAMDHGGRHPVMPDQGLAPGMANVLADIGYRKLGRADVVKIRVGGLPYRPKGRLMYGLTFNPQGLYNEYIEECYAIRDGRRVIVEQLGDVETFEIDGLGKMEAFNTSGGIADLLDTMESRGVKDCDYKTIRFPGHVQIIRDMLFSQKMDLETFSKAIVEECGFITEDQVLIKIEIEDRKNGKRWELSSRIIHDGNFTAMQKTTGFGAAAVAAILGEGKMDGSPVAGYQDVPEQEFMENIVKLIPEIGISQI